MTDSDRQIVPREPGEFILYQTEDGLARVEVRMSQDTVWLSLNQMAELFHRDKSSISKHLRNVFKEGELPREATVAKFATVQFEAGRQVERKIDHCNLDVIISVGYRVKSHRGTRPAWDSIRKRKNVRIPAGSVTMSQRRPSDDRVDRTEPGRPRGAMPALWRGAFGCIRIGRDRALRPRAE